MRAIQEKYQPETSPNPGDISQALTNVAVCVAAHNESPIIADAIKSLTPQIPASQIHIVSDHSSDNTAAVAQNFGCLVLELPENRGKAGALEAGLAYWHLLDRFDYVLLADADTIFSPNFIKRSLAVMLADPGAAVITAYDISPWPAHRGLKSGMLFVAYRLRLWRLLQALYTYGQTWKYTNILPVAPGFASFYRSRVLRHLKISVPGLAIEDFNLAFQIRRRKLGRIAHYPDIFAYSQDPSNLGDYWRQTRRWTIGFWQTIKYWKVWPSWFWANLSLYILENLLVATAAVLFPMVLFLGGLLMLSTGAGWETLLGRVVIILLIGYAAISLLDYLLTCAIAWQLKIKKLAIYGLGFFLLRYIDALILLTSIPIAWLRPSNGQWQSPIRYKTS